MYQEVRYPRNKRFDFVTSIERTDLVWRWKALDAAEDFRTDHAVTDEVYALVQDLIASAADTLAGWEQLYKLRSLAHKAARENPNITRAALVEVVRAAGLDLA